jgi:cobalamin biosynthesis Mg chelatase CobN
MPINEITTGLINAINRGEPLEKAIQSFINAGYNSQEVMQAAKQVNLGITQNLPPSTQQPQQTQQQQPQLKPKEVQSKQKKPGFFSRNKNKSKEKEQPKQSQEQQPSLQSTKTPQQPTTQEQMPVIPQNQLPQNRQKKKFPWIILILIIVLIILFGFLGLMFFAENLLQSFFG